MKSKFNKSLLYACKGTIVAVKQERNLRIHLYITMLVILSGIICQLSFIEWGIIFLCISSVISLEIINTAIEELVNFISPEYNKKAGKIKDLSSGSILVAAFFSVIIGCFIFIPKFLALFG